MNIGVNIAHSARTVGACSSAYMRRIYTEAQAAEVDGNLFYILFIGLDSNYSLNKFVSPDDVSGTTFETIPSGTQTRIINSLEQCECPTSFTESQFDAMTDDAPLLTTTIEETEGGRQHFTDEIVPRIVLFETADGRKGAIKIKRFIEDGQQLVYRNRDQDSKSCQVTPDNPEPQNVPTDDFPHIYTNFCQENSCPLPSGEG